MIDVDSELGAQMAATLAGYHRDRGSFDEARHWAGQAQSHGDADARAEAAALVQEL